MSGETRDTCETIGRALDVEHIRPEVLPGDRGAEVRALSEAGSVVAVIGHASGDDASLGAADVAVALGAAGSTPGEWAVALASDDVRDAATALAIAHQARERARAPRSRWERVLPSRRCCSWVSGSRPWRSPPSRRPCRQWRSPYTPASRRTAEPDGQAKKDISRSVARHTSRASRDEPVPPPSVIPAGDRPGPMADVYVASNGRNTSRGAGRFEPRDHVLEGNVMRPLVTILGFAAITAAATLSLCWPGRTYADPPQIFGESGEVDDITFQGEVARDPAIRNGWAIKVTYENRGNEDETCDIDATLNRNQVNPGSRSGPDGVAVWHHKEKISVPAHESVVRTYDVPGWMAAQLTGNEKAMQLREKMVERESAKPNGGAFALQMRPYTMYSVGFQKVDG